MQLFFDESGDSGDIKKRSNTKVFTVVIYLEKDEKSTTDFINNFLSKTKKKKMSVKWFKLNKKSKLEFRNIYKLFSKNIFAISCIKKDSNIFGEKLFFNMLQECIIKYELYGKYKYEGLHLKKILHKLKLSLKEDGKKVEFQNVKTSEFFGIQVSDLYSGMINEDLSHGLTDLENHIFYNNKN